LKKFFRTVQNKHPIRGTAYAFVANAASSSRYIGIETPVAMKTKDIRRLKKACQEPEAGSMDEALNFAISRFGSLEKFFKKVAAAKAEKRKNEAVRCTTAMLQVLQK